MTSSSIHGRQRSLANTIASATGKPMMRQSSVVSAGDEDRLDEDAEIERLERARIVGEGAADIDLGQARVLAEAIGPDDRERREEEHYHPDDGW